MKKLKTVFILLMLVSMLSACKGQDIPSENTSASDAAQSAVSSSDESLGEDSPVCVLTPSSPTNEDRYLEAMAMMEEKDFRSALDVFKSLGDYKDCREMVTRAEIGCISAAQPGQSVVLGSYEQDCIQENGAEPIEWIVLDNDGRQMLLISKYCLDGKAFNGGWWLPNKISWANCDLRSWINSFFFEKAFAPVEREFVLSYPTESNVHDKVFVLSADEAEEYEDILLQFSTYPTEYAISNGALKYEDTETPSTWWWLRDTYTETHESQYHAMASMVMKNEIQLPRSATDKPGSVRPAIWLDIERI